MTKKPPLVSIVLTSYNHAAYVEQALNSVLSQTYTNIEVIVVDDGSNDSSVELLQRCSDPRVAVVALNDNRAIHPRNHALKFVRGKYVAFQNSDDLWHQDKLSQQVAILERDQKTVACFTSVAFIDKESKQLSSHHSQSAVFSSKNQTRLEWLRDFFLNGNSLCISSAVVRTKLLKKVGGFHGGLIQIGDFDLWVKLAAYGELFIVQEQLTFMRIIDNTNLSAPSATSGSRAQLEYVQLLQHYIKPPLLKQLSKIFPDVIPEKKGILIQMTALIQYAWELDWAHQLFANQAFMELLNDDVSRAQVVDYFGSAIIHKFIKMTGRLNYRPHE